MMLRSEPSNVIRVMSSVALDGGAHSLAPLSFRAATYSGVFTLLPRLTGVGRANHGHILYKAAELAERGQLKPLLAEHQFGADDIPSAYDAVAKGIRGRLSLNFDRRSFPASAAVGLDLFRRKVTLFDFNQR